MKKGIILVLIFTCISGMSQTYKWTKTYGTSSSFDDWANSVTTDAFGNVYVVGGFYGTVDFNPGTATNNLTSNGSWDIFIQKLDADGNFLWVKQIGGADTDEGIDVKVDQSGNIYVVGKFENTVDFDPGTGVYTLSDPDVMDDAFVLKLNANGDFIWAKSFSNISFLDATDIELDAANNVYVTGTFYATADFDPGVGTYNLSSNGLSEAYITKLDSAGNFVWAFSIGGSSYDEILGMDINTNGELVVTGYFKTTVDFDPGIGTGNLVAVGEADAFTAKYDSSGGFIWAKAFSGSFSERGRDVAYDANGNIIVVGGFESIVDFDPGPGVSSLDNVLQTDAFVCKLDANGNFSWVRQIGSLGIDNLNSVDIDNSDNIIALGAYGGDTDFDPGTGTYNLVSNGGNDIFIEKLDANGNFTWVKVMGGSQDELARRIHIDAFDNIYSVGEFRNTVDFDPGTLVDNHFASGDTDIFIQKISQCVGTAPVPDVNNLADLTGTCQVIAPTTPTATNNCGDVFLGTTSTTFPITTPGTTVITWIYDDGNGNSTTQTQNVIVSLLDSSITQNGSTLIANASGLSYQWLDCNNGNAPVNGATMQTFTPTSNGNYAVEVSNGNCSATSACILVDMLGLDKTIASDLYIYPNPANDIINIQLKNGSNINRVVLFDANGRIVREKEILGSTGVLNLELLDKGVYIIQIQSEKSFNFKKILKK